MDRWREKEGERPGKEDKRQGWSSFEGSTKKGLCVEGRRVRAVEIRGGVGDWRKRGVGGDKT